MKEKTITFEQYKKDFLKAKVNYIPYLPTAWGDQEVTGYRTFSDGDWVVCGKANGGFGISYNITPQTILKIKIGSKYDIEREIREGKIKEEKTMVDIKKIIKLRNLVLKAIEITEEDKKKFEGDDEAHPALQYRLGMLHCQKDIRDKLNDLIIQG